MHEQIIANDLISKAKEQGSVKEITVEVGDLAHLPAEDLEKTLRKLTSWNIKIQKIKAIVKCSCGYQGEPKIIEHLHDSTIFECPKCKEIPNILKGNQIKLVEVKIKQKTKIYCIGNEFIKEDSLAKEIADEIKIQGVQFIKINNILELVDNIPDNIILMDVVQDLKEPRLINLEELISQPKHSHDLDLAFYLKLLKETGKLKQIQIIGIPQKANKQEIIQSLSQLISKKCVEQDMQGS